MKVIVLNFDYTYLNTVDLPKVMRYLEKGKVTVEKYSERIIRTVTDEIVVPLVVRLTYFVRSVYKRKVEWKKRNVLVRDNFTCVYCGSKDRMTVDHVHPKVLGGKDTFENTVASCWICNNRKGNKTLREARMFFTNRHFKPHAPTVMEFIRKYHKNLGVYEFLKELGIYYG